MPDTSGLTWTKSQPFKLLCGSQVASCSLPPTFQGFLGLLGYRENLKKKMCFLFVSVAAQHLALGLAVLPGGLSSSLNFPEKHTNKNIILTLDFAAHWGCDYAPQVCRAKNLDS